MGEVDEGLLLARVPDLDGLCPLDLSGLLEQFVAASEVGRGDLQRRSCSKNQDQGQ